MQTTDRLFNRVEFERPKEEGVVMNRRTVHSKLEAARIQLKKLWFEKKPQQFSLLGYFGHHTMYQIMLIQKKATQALTPIVDLR